MRFITLLVPILLAIAIAACSGIETRPAPIDTFAAGDYKYYKWRSDPLPNPDNSKDPMYVMDPILRNAVDHGIERHVEVVERQRHRRVAELLRHNLRVLPRR